VRSPTAIGYHFSPNDPRWRGASSDQFLKSRERVQKRGGRMAHLDLTIVSRRLASARIATHAQTDRRRCDIAVERVAVKATHAVSSSLHRPS